MKSVLKPRMTKTRRRKHSHGSIKKQDRLFDPRGSFDNTPVTDSGDDSGVRWGGMGSAGLTFKDGVPVGYSG